MASSIYDFSVPSGVASSFTNGELALCPDAAMTVAAHSTVYMCYQLFLEPGTYIIKCYAEQAASWWLGEGTYQSKGNLRYSNSQPKECLFFTKASDGVVTTTFNVISSGPKWFDIKLSNLSAASTTGYAVFSLWKDGRLVYASNKTDWLGSSAEIGDADRPSFRSTSGSDERYFLPVWTVLPNWKNGILERIEYKTLILSSDTDDEQRRSLRGSPRRSFEITFSRDRSLRARLDNMFAGYGMGDMLFPLFHEQYRPEGGLASGQTLISFPAFTYQDAWTGGAISTTYDSLESLMPVRQREYNHDDLILITNGDPEDFEVRRIVKTPANAEMQLCAKDTIELDLGVSKTWPDGTRIIPLRRVRFDSLPQVTNYNDRVAEVTLRVELRDHDSYKVADGWGYCVPLFRFRVDWSSNVLITHSRKTFTLDNETGVDILVDPGEVDRAQSRFSVRLLGREELTTFRQFLQSAHGRLARFWAPTYTLDIEPTGSVGGSYFDAKPSGYWYAMRKAQDNRVMLAFIFKDGRPTIYRRIVDVAPLNATGPFWKMTGERFFLHIPLPTFDAADLDRVTFVMPCRFDQDSFEIRHHTDDARAMTSSIVLRSSTIDGLPDIDCTLTSKPYGLSDTDSISVSIAPIEGKLLEMTTTIDEVTVSLTGVYAYIQTPLWTYGTESESLSVGLTAAWGELRSTLKTHSVSPEDFLSVTLTGTYGTLENKLLTYTTVSIDEVGVTLTAVGGTLA